MPFPTVQIADDDAAMIQLIRMTLEPMGVRVDEARDAMTALMKIHLSPPSIAILDVNMPSGNGLSVCEMLVTDTGLARLPIIVLTGEGDERVRSRCHDMGAAHVRKGPEAMKELKDLVRRILSDSESESVHSQMYIG
jgi:DNA-binding response OmpR family regulator